MNTMFCEFCKVSSLFLFVVCVSYCSASGREALFGFEEDTIKACMEEKSVTEDQVKEMEEAEEADEANACFFGCMLNKEGFIDEKGQLNQTYVDAEVGKVADKDEKEAMVDFYKKLGVDLLVAIDLCSGAQITQIFLYAVKKVIKEINEKRI